MKRPRETYLGVERGADDSESSNHGSSEKSRRNINAHGPSRTSLLASMTAPLPPEISSLPFPRDLRGSLENCMPFEFRGFTAEDCRALFRIPIEQKGVHPGDRLYDMLHPTTDVAEIKDTSWDDLINPAYILDGLDLNETSSSDFQAMPLQELLELRLDEFIELLENEVIAVRLYRRLHPTRIIQNPTPSSSLTRKQPCPSRSLDSNRVPDVASSTEEKKQGLNHSTTHWQGKVALGQDTIPMSGRFIAAEPDRPELVLNVPRFLKVDLKPPQNLSDILVSIRNKITNAFNRHTLVVQQIITSPEEHLHHMTKQFKNGKVFSILKAPTVDPGEQHAAWLMIAEKNASDKLREMIKTAVVLGKIYLLSLFSMEKRASWSPAARPKGLRLEDTLWSTEKLDALVDNDGGATTKLDYSHPQNIIPPVPKPLKSTATRQITQTRNPLVNQNSPGIPGDRLPESEWKCKSDAKSCKESRPTTNTAREKTKNEENLIGFDQSSAMATSPTGRSGRAESRWQLTLRFPRKLHDEYVKDDKHRASNFKQMLELRTKAEWKDTWARWLGGLDQAFPCKVYAAPTVESETDFVLYLYYEDTTEGWSRYQRAREILDKFQRCKPFYFILIESLRPIYCSTSSEPLKVLMPSASMKYHVINNVIHKAFLCSVWMLKHLQDLGDSSQLASIYKEIGDDIKTKPNFRPLQFVRIPAPWAGHKPSQQNSRFVLVKIPKNFKWIFDIWVEKAGNGLVCVDKELLSGKYLTSTFSPFSRYPAY
ncbi:hypothetical protein AAMO2058_000039700 [Amorphochlora amoebiformis]